MRYQGYTFVDEQNMYEYFSTHYIQINNGQG